MALLVHFQFTSCFPKFMLPMNHKSLVDLFETALLCNAFITLVLMNSENFPQSIYCWLVVSLPFSFFKFGLKLSAEVASQQYCIFFSI